MRKTHVNWVATALAISTMLPASPVFAAKEKKKVQQPRRQMRAQKVNSVSSPIMQETK